jgi:uncharacterized protein (DUF983 family)
MSQSPSHCESKKKVMTNKPVIQVSHADLERWDDGPYKSKCPTCKDGILMVYRNLYTFELLRCDRCISCGKQFNYTDSEINGERFEGGK